MVGNLYDFHSHILPGMDDGYRSAADSIRALKLSYEQGVRYMVATPHYYADESVEQFLERRQQAMEQLEKAMEEDGGPFPQLCLGAEVAYYPNISFLKELPRLCIGNSRFLLLELPFSHWGVEVLRDLQIIHNAGEVTPILAHFERYVSVRNKRAVQKMLELDLPLQMNAEFILARKTRRFAKRALEENPACLLGSDCHNLTDRQPNLGPALECLRTPALENAVRRTMDLGEQLWTLAVD